MGYEFKIIDLKTKGNNSQESLKLFNFFNTIIFSNFMKDIQIISLRLVVSLQTNI